MRKVLHGFAVLGCASIAFAQAGDVPQLASGAGHVAPSGNDCGLVKSPDQGAFWQPLGPSGSYVYANSFVPCEDGEVDELGMWLLDLGGDGGPDVSFEVWGSIGDNPASGPDAGNVLASTGSLKLDGTPSLEFYSGSATTTSTLSGGTTYWFVATCVGQAGSGSWQVGAHTQNSEGIFDNGTFWFSNDPAGINFDGQGFTPEMGFSVSLGGATCFADCDGNGELNILDFVCYQGLFQSGDPGADCNGDGDLNILDFVCFQAGFQAGCP